MGDDAAPTAPCLGVGDSEVRRAVTAGNLRVTRRDFVRAAHGAIMLGALDALVAPSVSAGLEAQLGVPNAQKPWLVDVHFHSVQPGIPGNPEDQVTPGRKLPLPPAGDQNATMRDRFAAEVEAELLGAQVAHALCMPRNDISEADPLGIREIEELRTRVRRVALHPIGLVHPQWSDRAHLARVESVLARGTVRGLKVLLGYFPARADDAAYIPYYRLAAQYDVPVVFHTGVAYSRTALLADSYPLQVDRVALQFPKTRFVLAHFGNPFLDEAAGVAIKNENVWVDLSGLLTGDRARFRAMTTSGYVRRTVELMRTWVEWVESPSKFLFGSDWPLAHVTDYREFVKRIFPASDHTAVFSTNARKVFRL